MAGQGVTQLTLKLKGITLIKTFKASQEYSRDISMYMDYH